jgi:hypothetical protein
MVASVLPAPVGFSDENALLYRSTDDRLGNGLGVASYGGGCSGAIPNLRGRYLRAMVKLAI